MWIVYLKDTAGIDWGHKYFNQEENARKYWEMLEGIQCLVWTGFLRKTR